MLLLAGSILQAVTECRRFRTWLRSLGSLSEGVAVVTLAWIGDGDVQDFSEAPSRLLNVKAHNVARRPPPRLHSEVYVERPSRCKYVSEHACPPIFSFPNPKCTRPYFGGVQEAKTVSQARYCLEILGGTCRLTEALLKQGLRVFPGIELLHGTEHDLTRRSTQEFIIDLILAGKIWYVHFWTPCTVWSRARHNIVNLQRAYQRELVGIGFAIFTPHVCELSSDLATHC